MNLSGEVVALIVTAVALIIAVVTAAVGATWKVTQTMSDYRAQNERDHGDLKKGIAGIDGKLSILIEKWNARPVRTGNISVQEATEE